MSPGVENCGFWRPLLTIHGDPDWQNSVISLQTRPLFEEIVEGHSADVKDQTEVPCAFKDSRSGLTLKDVVFSVRV